MQKNDEEFGEFIETLKDYATEQHFFYGRYGDELEIGHNEPMLEAAKSTIKYCSDVISIKEKIEENSKKFDEKLKNNSKKAYFEKMNRDTYNGSVANLKLR